MPLTYDALVGGLLDVFRIVADNAATVAQNNEVVVAQRGEITTLRGDLEESRATVARLSQVASEVDVLRGEKNAWRIESENDLKGPEFSEAQSKESALVLNNSHTAFYGLSALRRQHSCLEK